MSAQLPPEDAGRPGLFAALKNIFATLLSIGRTRAELLAVEIEEEKYRLIAMWAKAIGAAFLILCGLVPKAGAVVSSVPIEVLGGGVVVMFGMVCASGINILSDVTWNRRNMVIFAVALSVGFGLQLEPLALQHLPETAQVLLATGLLPAVLIAIGLNILLPAELAADATREVAGGMKGHGKGQKRGRKRG